MQWGTATTSEQLSATCVCHDFSGVGWGEPKIVLSSFVLLHSGYVILSRCVWPLHKLPRIDSRLWHVMGCITTRLSNWAANCHYHFVWFICLRVTVSVSKLWMTRTTPIIFPQISVLLFRQISVQINFNKLALPFPRKLFLNLVGTVRMQKLPTDLLYFSELISQSYRFRYRPVILSN